MAAQLKEEHSALPLTLRVRSEGLARLNKALEEAKAPPKKLIEMMRTHRVSAPKK